MRRMALLVAGVLALLLVPVTAASAHPLGNFTVNHYDGLVVGRHAVHDHAVVDTAEIPTQQARRSVDRDGDGVVTAGGRTAFAAGTCRSVGRDLRLSMAGRPGSFVGTAAIYTYPAGAARPPTAPLARSPPAA